VILWRLASLGASCLRKPAGGGLTAVVLAEFEPPWRDVVALAGRRPKGAIASAARVRASTVQLTVSRAQLDFATPTIAPSTGSPGRNRPLLGLSRSSG
jgi:hypothetical protein